MLLLQAMKEEVESLGSTSAQAEMNAKTSMAKSEGAERSALNAMG